MAQLPSSLGRLDFKPLHLDEKLSWDVTAPTVFDQNALNNFRAHYTKHFECP